MNDRLRTLPDTDPAVPGTGHSGGPGSSGLPDSEPTPRSMPSSLADAVLSQSRRTPHAPAVEDGDVALDYARLDRTSALVAARLRAHGVRAGQAVAVCLPRSWRLVCVMLGIRRIGATVVPLDRLSPDARRRHILHDSAAVTVVHEAEDPFVLPDHIDGLPADQLTAESDLAGIPVIGTLQSCQTVPGTPAFVFYTSGTTGRPKGVEVTDEGVLRLGRPGYLALRAKDRYACLSNPAFDALTFEIWAPLLTGGTCVVLHDSEVRDPRLFAAVLRERRIDTLFITVSLFNVVVDEVPDCFAGVGQVLIGGEQLNARLIRRWYETNHGSGTVLHNVYGPTEATTFALCHPIPRGFDDDVVPIGAPLSGTGLMLRTKDGRAAEPGELAELLLSGPALAIGYRNLPKETERRFVHLRHNGRVERWYRTGDLVRRDDAGRITYVGRADRLVKVRGFRIEPGEVERHLLTHPFIRRARVCTRRDDADRHELLAFLVLSGDLSYDAYERHLAAGLPPYMRPHRTQLIDEIPLNANGKADEAALLSAAHAPWRGTRHDDVHVTAAQREILDMAEDVLASTGLRPDDRWIPSGGDSLKALRFRFEILRRYSVDLPQSLILEADFAQLTEAVHAPPTAGDHHPPVAPASHDPIAPATSEQQRLWLLHQRDPEDRAYDVPLAFRIRGTVHLPALRTALRSLVERHPALRTRLVPTPQGLRQRQETSYDPWQERASRDGESWETAADRFFARGFDLREARMLRATWLPCTEESEQGATASRPLQEEREHDDSAHGGGVLLLHLHHVAVDGWSLNLLFRDLSHAYSIASKRAEAALEQTPGTTTLDFARWQQSWHASPAYERRRADLRTYYENHFRQRGEPSPRLESPESAGSPTARLLRTSMDLAQRTALDRLAAERGQTRFCLLLSAFTWSVYGVTGQTHPVVAAPVANRPRPEFAETVGMFANTVLVPLALDPDRSLGSNLEQHAVAARTVLDGEEIALADVLADRSFHDQDPLFDFLFVLENTEFSSLRMPDCVVRPVWPRPRGAKCALTLSVVEHESGFDCLWEYRDDLGADRAEAAARLFRTALERLTSAEDVTLADLVAPYRHALPDHGQGPDAAPSFATVADGFAHQVRRTPDAPAVTDGHRTLTYAELDALSASFASTLRPRLPADPSAPAAVALYLEPSIEYIVALLASARLNLTIVPLDPAYPPSLLRHVLDQIDPVCILVKERQADALDTIAPPHLQRHPVQLRDPAPHANPADLPRHRALRPLYTLFTSGSTGAPKGVQVPDRTLCNLLTWQQEQGGLPSAAVTQQFSMLSFDVSFQEIFTTLCSGGLLRTVDPAWRQDMPALLEQLESGGVERLFLPYVALHLLAAHGVRTGRYPSRLREVITAGEQLVCTDDIRRWFTGLSGARLFNHYGPTETHVVSSLCLEGDPATWPLRPAIGRPVAGARLRVVDDAGLPLPPGATGHLLLGGPMADRCYLGDTDLNRTRFIDDPQLGTLYRSGDYARFDAQGLLHYAGRADDQIKLSGHRLELGQVEAALLQYPGVTSAVAAVADSSLTACLVCRGDDPDPVDLTLHLSRLLPAAVRVTRFRRLTSLPRTPSGKLDRRAALTTAGHDLRTRTGLSPRLTPLEQRLAELFTTVTGRTIGVEDRFFDAGATSLDLMRFQLRCEGEDDLSFRVPDLFEHVTIRALARHLGPRRLQAPPAELPGAAPAQSLGTTSWETRRPADEPIAVIGMSVRLPGAGDLASFWDLVTSGSRGIEHFAADDGRVGARSQLDGLLAFDPGRFGISPNEARLMDPQQRHLLMACVEALAHAGVADPKKRRVGLIAACGENTYFQNLLREADPAALPDSFRLALHHEKDFLSTKTAYHLGLTGPAFTVQSACSSSLVGVHLATGLLRQGDADLMLAGGVLVDTQLTDGYTYRPQHIFSPDGHCRPFSADADGTIGASGVGVVVLKPLSAARRDGDTVYAVVTGSCINNDGSGKLSYSAPSLAGQRTALRTALHRSGRTGADVGYVEAHGTGTRLGDPVEASALREAYELADDARLFLSSVKSQIGHLGAAAGVVGLVRAVLAVHHGTIPPTADFDRLNPEIADGPFRIPATSAPWPHGTPRVAAVSSFGIGGTNAHLLLEKPDDDTSTGHAHSGAGSRPRPVLVLSAGSAAALRTDARRIADYLAAHPDRFPQVLRHLQAGRPALPHRAAAVCPDAASAVTWLRALTPSTAPVAPAGDPAPDRDVSALADAWTAGHTTQWPEGLAAAPWDFPPPAFELADYDFPRVLPMDADGTTTDAPTADEDIARPGRLPGDSWLHQPNWNRAHRAGTRTLTTASERTVVVVADAGTDPRAWVTLEQHYARVVRVAPGADFMRRDHDTYEADPADTAHLRALLADVTTTETGVDWLHALPLAIDGEIGERSLRTAQWACLDTVAALSRALADTAGDGEGNSPRVWLLSAQAQPVTSAVRRPEAALLAAATEVPRQEQGTVLRWADLPSPDPAVWSLHLPELLLDTTLSQPALALRDGFWWHRVVHRIPAPAAQQSASPAGNREPHEPITGTHLILGGTGGIGASVAARLLRHPRNRVVLLARGGEVSAALRQSGDRVTLVQADLESENLQEIADRLAPHLGGLTGIVHAVGTAAGSLLALRDHDTGRKATAAKLRGALLMELLIAAHTPDHAVYCSSMAAYFGGIGQFDYAAASACLDAFAQYTPEGDAGRTHRIGIGWDAWCEVGMAHRALSRDNRHQDHLAVALTPEEGITVFEQALTLRLPYVMVNTTPLDQASYFYEREPVTPSPRDTRDPGHSPGAVDLTTQLAEAVADLLGVDEVDSDASLYDLGADSLTLLELVDEVKRRHGTEIDLSRLSHRVSLTELIGQISAPARRADEAGTPVDVEVWQHGERGDVLCLVHPVGGDIQAYRPLVSALDDRLTVCLIADPALRYPQRPGGPIAERAIRYLDAVRARFPEPGRRLSLAGWSFGAWTALSMAAVAEKSGRPVHGLYLLDPPPPGGGAAPAAYDDRQVDAVFARELSGNRTDGLTARGRDYAERLAQCCRANLAAMAGHELPRLTRTPATVWLAERMVQDLPSLAPEPTDADAWEMHLPAPFRVHHVDTDHYGLVAAPRVRAVAAVIDSDLNAPSPAAPAGPVRTLQISTHL